MEENDGKIEEFSKQSVSLESRYFYITGENLANRIPRAANFSPQSRRFLAYLARFWRRGKTDLHRKTRDFRPQLQFSYTNSNQNTNKMHSIDKIATPTLKRNKFQNNNQLKHALIKLENRGKNNKQVKNSHNE